MTHVVAKARDVLSMPLVFVCGEVDFAGACINGAFSV